MSVVFDYKNNLIFTGGHDGSLLAWHFETGFIKHYLHECDPTMTSKNKDKFSYIKESKSIDCLLINAEHRLLISGSADQTIRFWDL